jgi:hypothetical protein
MQSILIILQSMKQENQISYESKQAGMRQGKEFDLRRMRNLIRALYAGYKSLLGLLYAGHRTLIRGLYDWDRVDGKFSGSSNRVEIRKSYSTIGYEEFTGLSPPAG